MGPCIAARGTIGDAASRSDGPSLPPMARRLRVSVMDIDEDLDRET
jgi:hypothetical protein